MGWRVLLAPLWVAALVGGFVAAVAYGRREAWSRWPAWPFVIGGAALFFAMLAWSSATGEAWLSSVVFVRALGVAVLVGSALLAFLASRVRARATLLLAKAPLALDEAVDRIRGGAKAMVGVFTGRIGSSDQVASPGGVVCALYEAELREASSGGVKGSLLSVEKAYTPLLYVRGERCRAKVVFAGGSLWAPVQVRRCRMNGRLSVADGAALASGVPPIEAVSYEKVAKLGEPCVVVGKLARGIAEGTYVIKGPRGGAALVAMGDEIARTGRRLLGRAWMLYGSSAALCVLAAWMISP